MVGPLLAAELVEFFGLMSVPPWRSASHLQQPKQQQQMPIMFDVLMDKAA